jgi:uncharacterized protein HemX
MDSNNTNQVPQEKSEVSPLIATIVIVVILIIGGYYFLQQIKGKSTEQSDQTINLELKATTTTGISSELNADLNNLQKDDLGTNELDSIDAQFK